MLRIIKRVLIAVLALSVLLYGYGYYKTRMLRDTQGPTIETGSDPVTISVSDPESVLLTGIRAYDSKDGDVTASLVVQGFTKFLEKGRRQVTVAAFDSDNNVTKTTFDVWYNDYTSPRFSLSRPLIFPVGVSETEIEGALGAWDCLDGNLSDKITVEIESADGTMDTYSKGTLRLIYSVFNSAGDMVSLPLTVIIEDSNEDSGVSLRLSQYLIYLAEGDPFDPKEYVTGMTVDYEEQEPDWKRITITNPVDTSVPGVYEVIFSVGGTDDTPGKEIYLPVIVE